MVFTTAITRVSFNRVDNTVLNTLNNTSMVGFAVLRARTSLVIPIEKDNHAGGRFNIVFGPLATILKPVNAIYTACIFRANASFDITALIGAPRDKAGAPLNARAKPVPSPVGLTANVAKLRQGNRNNLIVSSVDAVDNRTNNAKSIITSLRSSVGENIRVFESEIPFSVRAAECSLSGESIFSHDKNGKVAAAYEALTKEVTEIEERAKNRPGPDWIR